MQKKHQADSKEYLLNAAQSLMFEAFEAPTKAKAIAIAQKALLLSPDCADAYTFLAEFAKTDAEILALLLAGVAAGERAIGPKGFDEMAGSFWGFLETRPYMRALLQLGILYDEINELERAMECYNKLLELNPNDNQGVRDLLMPLLIVLDKKAESEKLYTAYKNDGCATWRYSRVLLDFRKHGSTEKAEKNLQAALERNIHIANALSGRKALPKKSVSAYTWGSPEEAITYLSESLRAWKHIPGAIEWLKVVTS